MAEDRNFRLKIMTPERTFYDDNAVMAEFNTQEGQIGVYKMHVPMTVILKPGVLRITTEDGIKEAALHTGFAEILQDRITIMAEEAEWPEEIDEARALAAKERAEERLRRHEPNTDMARAQTALYRAMARIEVLKK